MQVWAKAVLKTQVKFMDCELRRSWFSLLCFTFPPSVHTYSLTAGGGGVPYDQPRVQGTCQGLIYREISMICQHQLAVVSCNSTTSHRDGL